MDNRNSGLIWLLFLAAAIVAVWLFVPLSFSSETTVYTVGINTVDRKVTLPLPTTYKAVQSQQLVLYWIDGVTPPLKLIDCVVRDAENWTAWYPDRSGQLSMLDGKLSLYAAPGSAVKELQIRKHEYWWLKIADPNITSEVSKLMISYSHIVFDPKLGQRTLQ